MGRFFCTAQVVAANGVDHVYPLDAAEALFRHGGVFVTLDLGAGVESVALRLELSHDGTTWYAAHVYDHGANAYAAAVTVAADMQGLLCRLDSYAPQLRLIANNAGANPATLTAQFIPH